MKIKRIELQNHSFFGNQEFVFAKDNKFSSHTHSNGHVTQYSTLSTYVRNLIDHPDPVLRFTPEELRTSIELLIKLCR